MTKDQIIAMAQSVGAAFDQTMYGRTDYVVMTAFELQRFASLVAAQAAAEEREACAMVCESEAWRLKAIAVKQGSRSTNSKAIQASHCADAIRERKSP